MNLLDEMLFLNPVPYLPAFFVNTVYYQLGKQSTGPERAAGEDSSGVGATALGEVKQGKRVDLVWTTTK